MVSDILSDLIIRIKNGQVRGKSSIVALRSNLVVSLLNLFYKEGIIAGFSVLNYKELCIYLNYRNGLPLISNIEKVSRPSKRIFLRKKDFIRNLRIRNVYKRFGFFVISTNSGGLVLVNQFELLKRFSYSRGKKELALSGEVLIRFNLNV